SVRLAVPLDRNQEILRQTRDVTRYEPDRGRVAVRSLPVEDVERRVGRAVPRYRVQDVREPPPRDEAIERDRVRVYRPEPTRRPPPSAPPARVPRKAVPKRPPP